jgi:hypothetical protein
MKNQIQKTLTFIIVEVLLLVVFMVSLICFNFPLFCITVAILVFYTVFYLYSCCGN